MVQEQDELLDGLAALGCGIENLDGTTLVSLPDDYGEFVFERLGSMLYVGTTFMAPDEFADSDNAGTFYRFLLELQDRSLGCQFSVDRSGFLSLGSELYPSQQTPNDVYQMLDQIAFVIESCIHLCDQVLASGELPSDREVDAAFGFSENLH